MKRNAICWPVMVCLLQWGTESFAKTRAASQVAEELYETASQRLVTRQWKNVLWDLEMAILLDPGREAAKLKKEQLQQELRWRAEQFYLEGLRAYQSLLYEDAKFHWQMAFQFIVDPQDPYAAKIQRALTLLSPSKQVTENISHPEEGVLNKTRDGMGNVRTFLEAGNTHQAILSLKEILYESPANERAQSLLARLQDSYKEKPGSENLSEEIHKQFARAEELLEDAKQAQEKSNFVIAYEKYREAFSLFKGDDLKPPFYSKIVSGMKETEEKLTKQLEPLLQKWQKELTTANPDLKEMGSRLQEVLKKYPPSPKYLELLQKVYEGLQEKAKPLLIEAKTTQEIEGCRPAVPIYTRVKERAWFEEVPAWQEANRNLDACLASMKSGS